MNTSDSVVSEKRHFLKLLHFKNLISALISVVFPWEVHTTVTCLNHEDLTMAVGFLLLFLFDFP